MKMKVWAGVLCLLLFVLFGIWLGAGAQSRVAPQCPQDFILALLQRCRFVQKFFRSIRSFQNRATDGGESRRQGVGRIQRALNGALQAGYLRLKFHQGSSIRLRHPVLAFNRDLKLLRLAERGQLTDTIAGLAKLNNTRKARQVCAEARDMLGGNGILLENHVIRHMADIESIHTYAGTETMQTLIVGRDISGVSAFA